MPAHDLDDRDAAMALGCRPDAFDTLAVTMTAVAYPGVA